MELDTSQFSENIRNNYLQLKLVMGCTYEVHHRNENHVMKTLYILESRVCVYKKIENERQQNTIVLYINTRYREKFAKWKLQNVRLSSRMNCKKWPFSKRCILFVILINVQYTKTRSKCSRIDRKVMRLTRVRARKTSVY